MPYSAEPLLQAILASVDEGIHVVDTRGVTIYYNQQAGLLDGLDPGEVIGRPLLQVFPSLARETSTLLRVLELGAPILNQPQTFRTFKGRRITTVNSTYPFYHEGRLAGAVEVSKDITKVQELSEQVVALKAELLQQKPRRASGQGQARFTMDDLIGRHPLLQDVKEKAIRAARSSSPILVGGETGTGKEILVQAIHQASPRRGAPFVAQNCAALPEGLLEGILFGTVKGSFTGAEDRLGLFELAHGGTLLLDEINSMPLDLQAKLLRVLQDGRLRRVGEARERDVDVRVIATTNEDPQQTLQERRLRQDLYYRINVVYLELPPLRDRKEDLPVLCEHFIAKYGAGLSSPVKRLAPEVARFFEQYDWPGNVRELEHAIEAGLNLAAGMELALGDLPPHLQREAGKGSAVGSKTGAPGWRQALADAEREAIERALQEARGNVSRAARLLGIPRQTLQYRIKLLGSTAEGS